MYNTVVDLQKRDGKRSNMHDDKLYNTLVHNKRMGNNYLRARWYERHSRVHLNSHNILDKEVKRHLRGQFSIGTTAIKREYIFKRENFTSCENWEKQKAKTKERITSVWWIFFLCGFKSNLSTRCWLNLRARIDEMSLLCIVWNLSCLFCIL